MPIPIANIYYLLSYAWDQLDEKERVPVSIEEGEQPLDLFAKILISGTRRLLKRGIDKDYCTRTAEFPGVKGKLELSSTLKTNLQLRFRAICSFDEFSSNILTNRILVTTLSRLTRTDNLDHGLKQKIHSLRPLFGDIDPVALTPAVFSRVRYHRNNSSYRFLLNVCRMVADNLLPSEDEGSWHFVDFTRDEQKMNRLFEKFVFNFYRLETSYKVRVEEIKWKLDSASLEDKAFLPIMRTDITLQNSGAKIIVDAKYYRETMSERYFQKKIKSGNMYQLFSYLINQETEDPEH